MRTTKGYAAGVGTTGALMGAIGCAFAVLSTVVAVHGWPLELSAPGTSTLEDRGTEVGDALPPLGVFPSVEAHRGAGGGPARPTGSEPGTTVLPASAAPVASAFGPGVADRTPAARVPAGAPTPVGGPAASVASPAPGAGAGAATTPLPGAGTSGTGAGESPAPPPSGSGSSPTLGGTVAQATSGAGAAVSQTGQQLDGAVQGATSQLGGAVGQVSPAAGQVLAQTGQVAGGVVSGATGAAGQVVSGAGTTAGRLLGGLLGGR